jgi:hypothetical protein
MTVATAQACKVLEYERDTKRVKAAIKDKNKTVKLPVSA